MHAASHALTPEIAPTIFIETAFHEFKKGESMSLASDLKKKGVALALGGGAARGLAHIGVLKVLAEEGIPVCGVAGTSAGAVIGAAVCAGHSWETILEKARAIDWPDIVTLSLPRKGFLSLAKLEHFVDRFLGSKSFDELYIPFAAVAVDLISGDVVVLNSGSVAAAVRASCSIPGIFEPVARGGKVLADGGLRNDVPADVAAEMGPGTVIAVNLNSDTAHSHAPRNILDVIHYSFDILTKHGAHETLAAADIVICPRLDDVGYQELKKVDELVARGESATRAALSAYAGSKRFAG